MCAFTREPPANGKLEHGLSAVIAPEGLYLIGVDRRTAYRMSQELDRFYATNRVGIGDATRAIGTCRQPLLKYINEKGSLSTNEGEGLHCMRDSGGP